MTEAYDIIVVGAGPAGSFTAKAAAERGASVLMLDKRRELGVPVQCGEALSEDALDSLDIEPDPRWALNKIDAARLVSPSGKYVDMEQGSKAKVGYILDRKVFDSHMAARAVRAGADIKIDTYVDGLMEENGDIKGVTYESRGEKGEIRGEMVAAADGVVSKVARWAGFDTALAPNEIESGVQFRMVGIEIDSPSTMEFYFGNEIAPGGYVWIFPKGEDVANVGIGILPAKGEKPPIEYLKDFVESRPELSKGRILEINSGGVPVSGPLEKTYDDDILVVGDAARQVNPLTGGGINWSMRAGNVAGEVAARAVAEGDTSAENLEEYQDRWKDIMWEKLEKYNKGKEVMWDLDDDELDDLADVLQGVDFEEISLSKMLKVLAKANPKLMWKLKGLF